MKKTLSLVLALIMLLLSLCACGDDDTSSATPKVPEFNMTAVEFVSAFNNACPESLTGVGSLDASDAIDDNTYYAQHAFNNYTSFILYTAPETNKVQKAVLWLSPEGMSDDDSVYKFAAYTKIMLSAFVADETELNKAIESLRLAEELPYMYQNTYENEYMISYFSHDDTGLKLLVMPIAAKTDYDDLLPPAPTNEQSTTTPAPNSAAE